MIQNESGVGWVLPAESTQWDGSARRALGRAISVVTRPVVARSWDPLLHTCGAAAAVSLAVCVLFPRAAELVVFVLLMFFTSSPCSTFLPAASEPILMAFGKLYPPLLLACLGVIGIGLVEWVNYRLFGAVLHAPRLATVRDARLMRRATEWFGVAPFSTVVVCALTPVPFWMARACAVVVHYPMGRFILATMLGRFPRIWLYALLGAALPLTSREIALGGACIVVLFALVAIWRKRRWARAFNPGGAR